MPLPYLRNPHDFWWLCRRRDELALCVPAVAPGTADANMTRKAVLHTPAPFAIFRKLMKKKTLFSRLSFPNLPVRFVLLISNQRSEDVPTDTRAHHAAYRAVSFSHEPHQWGTSLSRLQNMPQFQKTPETPTTTFFHPLKNPVLFFPTARKPAVHFGLRLELRTEPVDQSQAS
jgi:hypothetical protein